jgi:hypothetical protein
MAGNLAWFKRENTGSGKLSVEAEGTTSREIKKLKGSAAEVTGHGAFIFSSEAFSGAAVQYQGRVVTGRCHRLLQDALNVPPFFLRAAPRASA